MKKTIYTFLFILLGLLSAKAQTILDEGFETTPDPFYVNDSTPELNSANAHTGSNCLYFAPAKGSWSQANNLFESNKWYHFSFWIKSSNPGELKLDHMPSDAYAVIGTDTVRASNTQANGQSQIKIRELVSFDASNFILVTCDVYSGTASLYEGFGAAGNLVIGWWGAGSYFDDWKIEGFDPNANWNFIPNGSFEADSLPWVYAWGDETIAKFSTDTNSAVGGKNSLMIEVVKPSSSSWYDAGIKNNFIIEVEKDSSYSFKFEAKAASARKMHFDVKVGEIKLLNKAIDLTDQVQTFIFPFVASTSGSVTIQLMPTISGATVYMDNMVFEKSKAVVHTGIKTEDVNCSVYPNPAKDKINIKAGNMKIIEILSMDGRILQSVTCTAQNEVIDIHHLKPGIYAARITFENNKTSVNMFVKQ